MFILLQDLWWRPDNVVDWWRIKGLTVWPLAGITMGHIYPYIDHFQSMTIFFVIDHGQWQFFCHWPGSMTLFWALSISFCHWLWSMTYGHKWYVHKRAWFSALNNFLRDHWTGWNCHWSVNDIFL